MSASDRPLPYYKWYIMDYRGSRTYRRLTWKQRGIYRELLDECWLEGGIPDDAAKLAELFDVPLGDMADAWQVLRPLFNVELPTGDGFYRSQSRLESMRTATDTTRAKRAISGRTGGQTKKQTEASAKQMQASAKQMPYSRAIAEQSNSNSKLQDQEPPPDTVSNAPAAIGIHSPPGDLPALLPLTPKPKGRKKTPVPTHVPAGIEDPLPRSENDWVAYFGDDWKDLTGGIPNYKQLGATLKPVVQAKGVEEARKAWRAFCLSDEQRFGWGYFVRNCGRYAPRLMGIGGTLTPAEIAELSRD